MKWLEQQQPSRLPPEAYLAQEVSALQELKETINDPPKKNYLTYEELQKRLENISVEKYTLVKQTNGAPLLQVEFTSPPVTIGYTAYTAGNSKDKTVYFEWVHTFIIKDKFVKLPSRSLCIIQDKLQENPDAKRLWEITDSIRWKTEAAMNKKELQKKYTSYCQSIWDDVFQSRALKKYLKAYNCMPLFHQWKREIGIWVHEKVNEVYKNYEKTWKLLHMSFLEAPFDTLYRNGELSSMKVDLCSDEDCRSEPWYNCHAFTVMYLLASHGLPTFISPQNHLDVVGHSQDQASIEVFLETACDKVQEWKCASLGTDDLLNQSLRDTLQPGDIVVINNIWKEKKIPIHSAICVETKEGVQLLQKLTTDQGVFLGEIQPLLDAYIWMKSYPSNQYSIELYRFDPRETRDLISSFSE